MARSLPSLVSARRWFAICARLLPGAAPLIVVLPVALAAQAQPKPQVYVRDVRIDSILLAFGVDSTRVRAAVVDAIRSAGRLASDTLGEVPALDIDVAVPRPLSGGMFDPRGYVRVEVGRNLVESGKARTTSWQSIAHLPEVPTWREFSARALAEVVRAVNGYLLSGIRGA